MHIYIYRYYYGFIWNIPTYTWVRSYLPNMVWLGIVIRDTTSISCNDISGFEHCSNLFQAEKKSCFLPRKTRFNHFAQNCASNTLQATPAPHSRPKTIPTTIDVSTRVSTSDQVEPLRRAGNVGHRISERSTALNPEHTTFRGTAQGGSS